MDLKFINTQKTPNQPSPKYLTIEISSDCVKSAVWEILNQKPKIISFGTLETLRTDTGDDLLTATDSSISSAFELAGYEPNQVVFSLPDSWVKGDAISDDKKPLLKQLTNKLDLKPIGFVVTLEALAHYLQIKNGSPPTVILIGLATTEISVTLIKSGNIADTHLVGRSDDLAADIEEGLARFGKVESFPSHLILFDGQSDLESQKQLLIAYPWQERLPFLHIPKITSLNGQDSIKAVVIAGGFEIVKNQHSQATFDPEEKSPDTQSIPDKTASFGFTPTKASTPIKTNSLSPSSFPSTTTTKPTPSQSDLNVTAKDLPKSATKLKVPHLKLNLPKFSLLFFSLIAIVVFSLITFSLAYAYLTFSKATLTLVQSPRIIEQQLDFTLDQTIDQLDIANSTIPASPQKLTVTGTLSSPATGTVTVGDQASGTVTIFNRTTSKKTFSAGTKLTAFNNLVYTIDESVTLASASSVENADLSVTTQPSSVDVKATATKIGSEYNIGTNNQLQVANFDSSSYIAKTKTDISGGTSRQVTAVSQKDLEKLSQTLRSKLETDAFNQANQNQATSSQKAIILENESEMETEFSAKVGEEADSVTLNATLNLNTISYQTSDLLSLVESQVKNSLDPNWQLLTNLTQISTNPSKQQSDRITAKAQVKLFLIPTIDLKQITTLIKGRKPQLVDSALKSSYNVIDYQYTLIPNLPGPLHRYPFNTNNISIKTEVAN